MGNVAEREGPQQSPPTGIWPIIIHREGFFFWHSICDLSTCEFATTDVQVKRLMRGESQCAEWKWNDVLFYLTLGRLQSYIDVPETPRMSCIRSE